MTGFSPSKTIFHDVSIEPEEILKNDFAYNLCVKEDCKKKARDGFFARITFRYKKRHAMSSYSKLIVNGFIKEVKAKENRIVLLNATFVYFLNGEEFKSRNIKRGVKIPFVDKQRYISEIFYYPKEIEEEVSI